jgi:prepilin-type processing-associated H-X9-DG protein
MRRSGFTSRELFAVLAVVSIGVIGASALMPMINRSPQNAYRMSCQSNLKRIALGTKQYNQDWDERHPLVNVNDTAIGQDRPLGWADALQPYLKSDQLFWCRLQIKNGARDESQKKPSDRDYTDYFYNRRLAGVAEEKIKQSAIVILLGEGNDGTDAANARYSLAALPAAWGKDEKSPSHRHLSGANYAFVDGHVKWIKARIFDKKPDGKAAMFTIN